MIGQLIPMSMTRQNQTIARACRAVNLLHGMTARVPQLMQQSHLESSEGKSWHAVAWAPLRDRILANYVCAFKLGPHTGSPSSRLS